MKTSCRYCEFNQKDSDGNQIGCELNLIERYKEKGISSEIEIKELDNKAYIVDTFCLFRRPPGWKKAKEEEAKTKSYAEIADSELIVDTTILAFIAPGHKFDEVLKFVENVNEMVIKPDKIIFINAAQISPLLFSQLNSKSKVNWSMEFIIDIKKDISVLRMSSNDIGARKAKTNFILTVDIDKSLNLDFISKIRSKLVDDFEALFVVLDDDDGSANFYQTSLYRDVLGNEQFPVNEKIQWKAENDKCQHLIKKTQEIFHTQKQQ